MVLLFSWPRRLEFRINRHTVFIFTEAKSQNEYDASMLSIDRTKQVWFRRSFRRLPLPDEQFQVRCHSPPHASGSLLDHPALRIAIGASSERPIVRMNRGGEMRA